MKPARQKKQCFLDFSIFSSFFFFFFFRFAQLLLRFLLLRIFACRCQFVDMIVQIKLTSQRKRRIPINRECYTACGLPFSSVQFAIRRTYCAGTRELVEKEAVQEQRPYIPLLRGQTDTRTASPAVVIGTRVDIEVTCCLSFYLASFIYYFSSRTTSTTGIHPAVQFGVPFFSNGTLRADRNNLIYIITLI